MMHAAVNALYAEYLEHTGGDKAAAASLALAAVMQRGQPMPAGDRPLTLPEVAKHLRVRPNKVLAWIRDGELRAYNVAARHGGLRPKYRVNPEDLAAFSQRRAVVASPSPAQPAGRRRPLPVFAPPEPAAAKRERGPSPAAADHR